MAKAGKAEQLEAAALEALAGLMGAPGRVLHGSKAAPGVFKGTSAGDKAAATFCLERGWLEPTGEFAGKGKTRKDLYRLSPTGLQAVLAHSAPTALLEGVKSRLESFAAQTEVVPRAVAAQFDAIKEQLNSLQAGFTDRLRQALGPLGTVNECLEPLRATLTQTLARIKPPSLDDLRGMMNQGPAGPASDWSDEVPRLAAAHKKTQPFQRLTLPQVFEHLRGLHPDLTLGQFHDGLRRLHESQRIRLGPYTQALATLEDPRNALYLDREVKYYVELP